MYFDRTVIFSGLGIQNLNMFLGSDVKNLQAVLLYSTCLSNIEGLRGFKELSVLILRGSELTSFEVLSELPKLRELDISYSRATSLASLEGCISLEELTIDKESKFSLDPIRHLMSEHLNSSGELISLKIREIEGRLKKEPIRIRFGDKIPKIEGKYEFLTIRADLGAEGKKYFSRHAVTTPMEVEFKDGNFIWRLESEEEALFNFSYSGTYEEKYNLLYFTDKNSGKQWYCAFFWDWYDKTCLYIYERSKEGGSYCEYLLTRKD